LTALGALRAVALACAVASCVGCGPVSYTIDAGATERMLAAARASNASYHAPYELWFAEACLTKAREEASQGAYEDALRLLEIASAYGKRALERSGGHLRDLER
jgi:hypothetical protein